MTCEFCERATATHTIPVWDEKTARRATFAADGEAPTLQGPVENIRHIHTCGHCFTYRDEYMVHLLAKSPARTPNGGGNGE